MRSSGISFSNYIESTRATSVLLYKLLGKGMTTRLCYFYVIDYYVLLLYWYLHYLHKRCSLALKKVTMSDAILQ